MSSSSTPADPIAVHRVAGVQVALYGDDKGPVERRQHDPVETVSIYTQEQSRHLEGKIKRVTRTVDVLKRMVRNGTIVKPEARAGAQFRNHFDLAHFDPLKAADLERLVGGEGGDVGFAAARARKQVISAVRALGGFGCPAANIVWDVLGLRMSLGQWTEQVEVQGSKLIGRARMNTHRATGIFVASLGVLAGHYGFGREP